MRCKFSFDGLWKETLEVLALVYVIIIIKLANSAALPMSLRYKTLLPMSVKRYCDKDKVCHFNFVFYLADIELELNKLKNMYYLFVSNKLINYLGSDSKYKALK